MTINSAFLVFLVILTGFSVWVRFAPSAPERWHVDPEIAKRSTTPNAYLLRPGNGTPPTYNISADELASAFDEFVTAKPNVTRLAGGPDEKFATYIARSRLMAYPDYVSVRFLPLDDNSSTLAVYSRSRFGYGDRGVNKGRIKRWLAAFSPK